MMNKPVIFGSLATCALTCIMASCGSEDKTTAGTGGQSSTGGSADASGASSIGGQVGTSTPQGVDSSSAGTSGQSVGDGGTSSAGSSGAAPVVCDSAASEPAHVDGGLVRIGGSLPEYSVPLDVGGYYVRGGYEGFCYTIADGKPDGSTASPPCGTAGGECFTKESGLCISASLGIASDTIWGAGVGCALNQDTEGSSGDPVSLVEKTGLSVAVYGCRVPDLIRVQLNIYPPIYDAENDILHSGYYCADVALSQPDESGMRNGTVPLSDLREDCWTGDGLLLDPTSQTAESITMQVGSDKSERTDWDFCLSKLSLD